MSFLVMTLIVLIKWVPIMLAMLLVKLFSGLASAVLLLPAAIVVQLGQGGGIAQAYDAASGQPLSWLAGLALWSFAAYRGLNWLCNPAD